MRTLDPSTIDLPTLAALAGAAANEHLLATLRAAGHPSTRLSHGYVFQHLLVRKPTVSELAGLLRITQQGASKVVRELEELGYVARVADGDDSRVRRVQLTGEGRAVVEASRAARKKLEATLVREVGKGPASQARRVLVALLAETGGLDAVANRTVEPPSR